MKRLGQWIVSAGMLLSLGFVTVGAARAEEPAAPPSREKMIAAARELIGTLKYCALITVDANGQPQVRTMNPFPPEDDMSVWMATTTKSRKYAEIQKNPRVTLYYANHAEATGYVSLTGRAVLVDGHAGDPEAQAGLLGPGLPRAEEHRPDPRRPRASRGRLLQAGPERRPGDLQGARPSTSSRGDSARRQPKP